MDSDSDYTIFCFCDFIEYDIGKLHKLFVVYCIEGVFWGIAPLAHLIIIKAGRKEHSKILVWAGWDWFLPLARGEEHFW